MNKIDYPFLSPLGSDFNSFIAFKEQTGRKPTSYLGVLGTFDKYCAAHSRGEEGLTKELVEDFLQVSKDRTFATVLTYASVLRELGQFMRSNGAPEAFVTGIRGSRESRYVPHIFSKAEIVRLLECADNCAASFRSEAPNMKNVVSCLYAVLYCTGMRVSEALGLKVANVSLAQRIILVDETKNGKQRLLPISESLADKCGCYLSNRISTEGGLFFDSGSTRNDGRINKKTVYWYFRSLLDQAGMPHGGKGHGPRLHDLRHTFAVHSLQQLSSHDGDVNAHLEYLSLYLGHSSIYETQDYLWMTDDLVSEMLERSKDMASFVGTQYFSRVVERDA